MSLDEWTTHCCEYASGAAKYSVAALVLFGWVRANRTAHPKSEILATIFSSVGEDTGNNKTLSHLMSLWTMSQEWRASNPAAMSEMNCALTSQGNRFCSWQC